MISKLAYVHPDAKIGNNVTVEPFAYIAGDVVIGDGCWIGPGAVIHDGARIGKGCRIHTAASVSCLPQDLKFAGEVTTAEIGDYNDIREYVTISRGTASRGKTVVGDHNLLMAYVHIAHDDVVGSNCVIANRVSLAGEVEIGDWVVIGGHAAIHQWTRIGEIHDACRILFQSGLNYMSGCEEVEKQVPQSKERDELVKFIRESKRGIIKPYESVSKEE